MVVNLPQRWGDGNQTRIAIAYFTRRHRASQRRQIAAPAQSYSLEEKRGIGANDVAPIHTILTNSGSAYLERPIPQRRRSGRRT